MRPCVLLLVIFSLGTTGSATSFWQPAYATRIEATMNTKSTFVVAAWVTLPNSCYIARIEHRVPIDPKSPGYFVEQQRKRMTLCGQVIQKCIVTAQFLDPLVPHSIVAASRRETGTDWMLWKVPVTRGSTPTATCKRF